MIAKVVRGYRPAGLLAYLFGPGTHEEHRDPRVVASWDGAPWAHQPEPAPRPGAVVAGEFDLDLRPLIATMQEEPRRAGLPLRTPPPLPPDWRQALIEGRGLPTNAPAWARLWRYDAKAGGVVLRPGYVWHCPVRLAPTDRTLSDREWETVAERLMRAVGIEQAGCRWVAVRHADDHIHLMATLVSETTGTRFHPYRDFLALRNECRAIERELGLTATAPADRTARPAPTRAERAKAERSRRSETARDELHWLVSHAAATTASGETFLLSLSESGLDPRVRRDEIGRVVGYTVGLPGDATAGWERVRYSGRALAPDLTWPRLHARWASITGVVPADRARDAVPFPLLPKDERDARRAEDRAARAGVTAIVHTTIDAIRRGSITANDMDAIAHATGELVAALDAAADTPHTRELARESARHYDRASRTPYRVIASPDSDLADVLRIAARHLARAGSAGRRSNDVLTLIAVILVIASLIAEIAAWQRVLRQHQANAATTAAASLRALAEARAARQLTLPTPRTPSPAQQQPTRSVTSGLGATPHRRVRTVPPSHGPGRSRSR